MEGIERVVEHPVFDDIVASLVQVIQQTRHGYGAALSLHIPCDLLLQVTCGYAVSRGPPRRDHVHINCARLLVGWESRAIEHKRRVSGERTQSEIHQGRNYASLLHPVSEETLKNGVKERGAWRSVAYS